MAFDAPHGAEHAAPALTEEVVVIGDAEMFEQVGEFSHEEVRRPEGGVEAFFAEVRGVAVAELVVEDNGNAIVDGKGFEAEKVVVTGSGTAVEGDEGAAGLGGFEVAVNLVPSVAGLVFGEGRVVEANGVFSDRDAEFGHVSWSSVLVKLDAGAVFV